MNRTLLSAQANLAGLYPPEGVQIWNENLLSQPIPIHSMPLSIDTFIGATSSSCQAYQNAYNKYIASANMKRFNDSMQPIYDYLTANLGIAVTSYALCFVVS